MIGLPTMVSSRMSDTSTFASRATSAASALSAPRTASVICCAPPGCIME